MIGRTAMRYREQRGRPVRCRRYALGSVAMQSRHKTSALGTRYQPQQRLNNRSAAAISSEEPWLRMLGNGHHGGMFDPALGGDGVELPETLPCPTDGAPAILAGSAADLR